MSVALVFLGPCSPVVLKDFDGIEIGQGSWPLVLSTLEKSSESQFCTDLEVLFPCCPNHMKRTCLPLLVTCQL